MRSGVWSLPIEQAHPTTTPELVGLQSTILKHELSYYLFLLRLDCLSTYQAVSAALLLQAPPLYSGFQAEDQICHGVTMGPPVMESEGGRIIGSKLGSHLGAMQCR